MSTPDERGGGGGGGGGGGALSLPAERGGSIGQHQTMGGHCHCQLREGGPLSTPDERGRGALSLPGKRGGH